MTKETKIAGIVICMVLFAVILSAAWIFGDGPFAPASSSQGPSQCCVMAPIAMGTFSETRSGTNYSYNATIQSLTGGLTWGDMSFWVQSPSGESLTGAISIAATTTSNTCDIALYSFSTATWGTPTTHCLSGTLGSNAAAIAGDSLDLLSATNFTDAGDRLVIILHGPASWTASFQIF